MNGKWIYHHDGISLDDLLTTEFNNILSKPVNIGGNEWKTSDNQINLISIVIPKSNAYDMAHLFKSIRSKTQWEYICTDYK